MKSTLKTELLEALIKYLETLPLPATYNFGIRQVINYLRKTYERMDLMMRREELMCEIGYRVGLIGLPRNIDTDQFVQLCAAIYNDVCEATHPLDQLAGMLTEDYISGLLAGLCHANGWFNYV